MTGLFATLAAIALPQMSGAIDRGRAVAAARYFAGQCALARMQAVMRSAKVAIRFDEAGTGYRFAMFVDGDGDGVRMHDIAAGIDRRITDVDRLSDKFPGVTVALGKGEHGGDPVRLGAANLLTFTPIGTATSGTIFLHGRDGSQFAVRVLGPTARTRVVRYDDHLAKWVEF